MWRVSFLNGIHHSRYDGIVAYMASMGGITAIVDRFVNGLGRS